MTKVPRPRARAPIAPPEPQRPLLSFLPWPFPRSPKAPPPQLYHAEFVDTFGSECSVSQSTNPERSEFVWVGVDKPKRPLEEDDALRMRLSREQAAELWPVLKHFAEGGRVEESPRKTA